MPQLFESDSVLTHAPLQSVDPAGHVFWQIPLEHTWPEAQTVPQPPQLFTSELVLVHVPAQTR